MKRLFIVLVAVFALFGRAQAQSFNAGVIAGATFCQVDGEEYAGFHQLGFTVGAYANLPFGDYFSGQMELKYSLLGAHSSDKEVREYGYNPYSLRMHYVEIPLMLRYNLGVIHVNFITLEAGASIDVLLKATENVMNGGPEVTTRRWSRISATANAGLHFDITKHLGIGARFMYSVAPCRFVGNPTPGWFRYHYYNKVIQLTLTYNINSPLK
jgi:opacity protein-like surface antigen